ncbi:MAG: UvrB/UvrC motif-containing protein [Candidatus Staskawiczbacteria bacterium]
MDGFKIIPKSEINELPKTSGVYIFVQSTPVAKRRKIYKSSNFAKSREARYNFSKITEEPRSGGDFYSFKNELIYIGKAIDIRDRVKNHFQQPSYRDDLFIEKVNKIGFFETNSEIEALILEANLIKKYQPKYNVVWRDDKNYFYVAITKDERPVIYVAHQKNEAADYIGPFVEGTALKKTLRFLRRVFPYYTTKKHPKNKCTYCHLGLCPGPNPDLKEYKKNIKKLILILQGKRNAVLKSLKKEMKQFSKENKFEQAAKIRDRIYNLQQVMAHTRVLENRNLTTPDTGETLAKIIGLEKPISRIECYDISNIQGKQATGSMVVFVDGEQDKSQYKKFKIKTENTPNDIAMIKEVLQRRFAHEEWQYPEVILIDGGIAQLNVAINTKNHLIPQNYSERSRAVLNAKTKNIKIRKAKGIL